MNKIIFTPKLSTETNRYTVDFTDRLVSLTGVTADPLFFFFETLSTASVTIAVYSGTDASPANMLLGSPTITGNTITQNVQGGVVGVTYELTFTATTSLTDPVSGTLDQTHQTQTLVSKAFLTIKPSAV